MTDSLVTVTRRHYPDDESMAEQIEAVRRFRQELAEEEHRIVAGLRLKGVSWRSIGGMFGITRQAAQQRFSTVAPPPKTSPEPSTAAPQPPYIPGRVVPTESQLDRLDRVFRRLGRPRYEPSQTGRRRA